MLTSRKEWPAVDVTLKSLNDDEIAQLDLGSLLIENDAPNILSGGYPRGESNDSSTTV